jgi:hypothetical protein
MNTPEHESSTAPKVTPEEERARKSHQEWAACFGKSAATSALDRLRANGEISTDPPPTEEVVELPELPDLQGENTVE